MKTIIARVTQEESDKALDLDCKLKYALRREGYDEYRAAMVCLMAFYSELRVKYGLENSVNLSLDMSNNTIMDYTPDELGKTVPAAGDMEPPNTL